MGSYDLLGQAVDQSKFRYFLRFRGTTGPGMVCFAKVYKSLASAFQD